jgi:hypothetical protein
MMRKPIRQLLPWKHLLMFLVILCVTSSLKYLASRNGWIAPPLAAWELAALVHVLLVAMKMTNFGGFVFASKKFNSGIKILVLIVTILLIVLKLAVIIAVTEVKQKNGLPTPIINSSEPIKVFSDAVHTISPYIILIPLVFFLFVNFFSWLHVTKQAGTLGFHDTIQEQYLVGLMKFVDAPVVLPFAILFVYLKLDRIVPPNNEGMVFGIIGCCLLIVSNLLTGVFDEHWSDVTKNRREHSSGLA